MKKNEEVPSLYSVFFAKKLLNTRGKLIIFMLCCSMLISPVLSAQGKNVTINMQNVTLEQLIWEIQKQTDYVFLYGAQDVKVVKGLDVSLQDRPVLEVLDQYLKDTDLIYTVEELNVVIKKKAVQSLKEMVTVKGVVKDESGETLPGVSVMVKGTTRGAATDIDGKFEFTVEHTPGMVIVFSFIGMTTQEVPYTGQEEFNVVLIEESQAIEEVVVTGYQRIDRRLFTGSADVLKASDVITGGTTDISRNLQGKSAGVQIQNVSGTFGAAPKMRVRGSSSILGDQKPLWVVDGIVLEDIVNVSPDDLSSGDAKTLISSAVAGINSDDIETIQVLKDASATALYGARAMNGVVVITTKRGRMGFAINYSGELTMRLKPSYNQFNIMNSQQQMMFYRDMEEKGWLNYSNVLRESKGGIYWKMYNAMDQYIPGTGFLLENTEQAKMKYLQQYERLNTDWFDIVFKNSIMQSHSVSISGGGDKSRFFTSLSYLTDPGWSVADKVTRYTANMNASFDINEYIRFNFLTSNSFRNQRAPGTIVQEIDNATGEVSRQFDLNPFSYSLNTSRAMRPYTPDGKYEYYIRNFAPFNILNEVNTNYIDIDMLDSKFQGEIEVKPMAGWDIKLMGAIRYVKTTREHKIEETSNMAQTYRTIYDATIRENNDYLYADPDNPGMPKDVVLPQGGFYNRTDNRLLNYYVRGITNYTRNIKQLHVFNVTAGMEARSINKRESNSRGFGIQYDRGNVPFVDYRIIKQILERGDQYYGMENIYDRFVAFFLTGGFSWEKKYTINLTGRYDGSNHMGESTKYRWLPTWNVSGAWHVYSEPFMKDINAISLLTLRATYGLTASTGPVSNAKAIFANDITYRPTQGERENQIKILALENSKLTWEKQYEFNVGLDVGLFTNRISMSTDVYFRKMFDLIGVLRTMGIGGEPRKYANYADMKAHGVEFTLNTRNIENTDYSWSTNLTFAYNKNEITNLTSNSRVIEMVAASGAPHQGGPVRGIYAIPFKGLNGEGLPTFLDQAGDVSVTGINFQESKNLSFLRYMGSTDPKYTGGLDNGFTYGPFRLNIFLTYQFGSKVWLDKVFRHRYHDSDAFPKEFADRWMVPGDEKRTNIPALLSKRQYDQNPILQSAYNAYNYSTERVVKGDFIRLKDIALTYEFPSDLLKQAKIKSASVRLSASNLALLYSDKKLKGQDPEFITAGGVSSPIPRQFTLTLKVGF